MSNNQNQAAQAATQGASIEAECRIAAGLKGLAAHVRAVSHYKLLLGDMEIVDQAIAAFECRTVRRTPAAATGDGDMPPLPPRATHLGVTIPGYTVGQMQAYARAAIAADRAQQAGAAAPSVKTWNRRILELETIPNNKQMPLETMRAMAAEIDDLRAQLVHSEESVAQYQQNVQELAEELRAARAQLVSERQAKEYEQQHAVESEKAVAQLQAQLAAKSQGEPVAWGNFKEDCTCVGLSQHPEDIARWQNPRPLYLAAPASAQPAAVDKINMAQAGVGERAHGYVAGWNDCVDEHLQAGAQPDQRESAAE